MWPACAALVAWVEGYALWPAWFSTALHSSYSGAAVSPHVQTRGRMGHTEERAPHTCDARAQLVQLAQWRPSNVVPYLKIPSFGAKSQEPKQIKVDLQSVAGERAALVQAGRELALPRAGHDLRRSPFRSLDAITWSARRVPPSAPNAPRTCQGGCSGSAGRFACFAWNQNRVCPRKSLELLRSESRIDARPSLRKHGLLHAGWRGHGPAGPLRAAPYEGHRGRRRRRVPVTEVSSKEPFMATPHGGGTLQRGT